MATTLTLPPKTQMTGSFQDVAPLPVDGGSYVRPEHIWTVFSSYTAGDGNAAAVQSGPTPITVFPSSSVVQVVATAEYAWVDAAATTHNIPYPTVPAQYGGAIQAGDLIVVDLAEQENGTTAAPSTFTGFTSRGSFTNAQAWVPRDSRLFKMSGAGGETGTFAVTFAVARRIHGYVRVIRGVDPTSFFDVGAATVAYGQGNTAPDPPANGASTVPGSLFEYTLAGNNYPSGATTWDPDQAPDGLTLNFANTNRARYFISGSTTLAEPGSSLNPPEFTMVQNPDNWTILCDIYKAKVYTNATLILLTAMADDTGTTSLSGSPPTIPQLNTLQRITSTLTAGTFTLTFGGNTTAAINFNDSAATIQTRLRALASIGATGCNVTGGPINSNPVVVEFTGALGGADQALITTSTGSVVVDETQIGAPGYTFVFEGTVDVPRTIGGTYSPQFHVWSLSPSGQWPDGRAISQTISSHAANDCYASILIAMANLYTNDPVASVFGTFVADPAESVAQFGTITPAYQGSLILAALAKSTTTGASYSVPTPYRDNAPYASDPSRYVSLGKTAGDSMTLQTWISSPVAAGSVESLSTVAWNGVENYTDTLIELRPKSTAGTKTVVQVLAEISQSTWLELANAMGSLYEIIELDLKGVPADAKFSSISFTFSHESDVRGALRVVPVGINAAGTVFTPGQERRIGGYQLDQVNAAQTVTTGEWFELADGSRLADYSRIGVVIFSTRRHDALLTHKLYGLTAQLTFETGGPVVANVFGPTNPGDPIVWEFSSGGGLAQRAVRVVAIQGPNHDLDVTPTEIYPVNPLNAQDGEIVADSGWLYGATRRSHIFPDQPLGRGQQTFLVRAKALMNNGVEIMSRWGVDEIQDISGAPPAPGAQGGQPRYNPVTGGVDVALVTPAGVSRAWLSRSIDGGVTWKLAGPFTVAASSSVVVSDYEAPLGGKVRYTAAFDSGPNSETTTMVTVGTGDASTKTDSWWLLVPSSPSLNTRIEVSRYQWDEPRQVLTAGDATGAIVVDSGPLPDRISLTLRARSKTERDKIAAAVNARLTMRLVNVLGIEWNVRLASGIERQQLRWQPLATDLAPLRDAHEITLELQEVA